MFKRVYIEISNICNLQCSFCPVVERDKKVMEPASLEKVLPQVAPIAEEVCLHLMGEPLAHPEFKSVMELCDRHRTPVQLTTNGVVIEKRVDDLLKFESLRQINFSLQSYRDNFPEKPLRDYMLPILEFTRKLHEVRPEVYVNYRLWNIGRQESNENEELFDLIERFFDIEINRNIQVENIKSKRIWNRLYLHFDSHFEWPSMELPHQGTEGRCHGMSGHIGIHADGTVVPCCLDKEAQIPLGNCLDNELTEILKSPRALAIKEGFARNKRVEEFCQHCTFINRFN